MNWYPTPTYLLRRKAILELVGKEPNQKILEIGCGLGDLLNVLDRCGHNGIGIDTSKDAINYVNKELQLINFKAINSDIDSINDKFDIVIASEVIEHCEDDFGLIVSMLNRIKPTGKLIITIPAHMADWDSNDDFCGHLRRYEKDELYKLLETVGFCDISIKSYGFPLFNLLKPIYSLAIKNKIDTTKKNNERTQNSGSMWLFSQLSGVFEIIFNNITMIPFYIVQKYFYKTDLGKGYCASGQLK